MSASEKGNSTTAGGDPMATGQDATGGDPTVTGSQIHHSREGTQMRVVAVGSMLSLPAAVRRERRSLELPVAVEEESGVRGEAAESSLSAASVTGACARGLAEAEVQFTQLA
ncbi:Os02g0240866 [Oryza sativa Japonica Group]|uniref:Os02g0240866 protein n=1 Tax=Oryza sativa subsp. japonica TaxID=39947 RepID=A0A0P0VGY2_ORYSJ|nr:Os02g0240866 [Oryza sativa Japonica Group]